MGTPTGPDSSARSRHAGRTSRAARAGMVLAVVAVTATVGIGTWVLGSGADAAPRRDAPAPTLTGVSKSEPPLSIAPPPAGESERKTSKAGTRMTAKGKGVTKSSAAGAR